MDVGGDTLRVSVAKSGGRTTVALAGELDLYTGPRLRDALDAVIASGAHRIEVDLRNLTFCDCFGLSILLAARLDALRVGCAFGIVGPLAQTVRRLFQLGGVSRVLPVHPSTPGPAAQTGGAPPRSP
ncbi:STAS domain-containing protein [Streptomyces sp. 2.9]|uniref:STAS domain-containing protein n=1 Tax=Streptomyces tritrimontium TaxID=3406573 RepID=UPI003BB7AB20